MSRLIFLIVGAFIGLTNATDCIPRNASDGIICVCNATTCDTIAPVVQMPSGNILRYETNTAGLRFSKSNAAFISGTHITSTIIITINAEKTNRTIVGFGGGLSDSSIYNIQNLNDAAQDQLMNSYFGQYGIEYSMIRVSIGSSDFSPAYYTYDEVSEDTTMTQFNLTDEDFNSKIASMKKD